VKPARKDSRKMSTTQEELDATVKEAKELLDYYRKASHAAAAAPSVKTPQEELEGTLQEMKRLVEKLGEKAKSDDEAETAYGEWKPKLEAFEKRLQRVLVALLAAETSATEERKRAEEIKPDPDDSSEERRNKEAQKKELLDSIESELKLQKKAADEEFERINKEAVQELKSLKVVPGTT
jgi:hypothetical protein